MRAIIVTLAFLLITGPVLAQQTPAQYCAALPANSCEILNIEPYGVPTQNLSEFSASGLVKYCKQNQFRIITGIMIIDSDNCGGCSGREHASGFLFRRNGERYVWGARTLTGDPEFTTLTSSPTAFCAILP